MSITQEDIKALVRQPSIETRQAIIGKICHDYGGTYFSSREQEIAEEIFRLLVKDTEVKVRKTLAEALCIFPDVPRDVVMMLVSDEPVVAEPVLRYSPVLEEEDLITLVHAMRSIPKLTAIARRECVSEELADALIDTGEKGVIQTVIRNSNAMLGDRSLRYVLEEYYNDDSVLQELVYRGGLPQTFAEKLFHAVSENLQRQLTKRYRLPKIRVNEALESARHTAMLKFLAPWMSQADISSMVKDMQRSKRLDANMVVRSLCIGDVRFFETALAALADVPLSNAKILMMDNGEKGFQALYEQCDLPQSLSAAVRCLYKLAQEETDFGRFQLQNYSEKMVERILQEGYNHTVEGMSTVLTIIGNSTYAYRTVH